MIAMDRIGRVGVIRVSGVFGGSPYEDSISEDVLEYAARYMAGQADLSCVAVVVDSPGGKCLRIANPISALNKVKESGKRLVGVIDGHGCSGGYWLVSRCDELVATRTSVVGSIGGIVSWTDATKALEDEGIRPISVKTGKHKGVGNPIVPTTDDTIKVEERLNESLFAEFLRDVSQGRGLTEQAIRGMEAATFAGEDIVANKLVDRLVPSVTDFLEELNQRFSPGVVAGRATTSASRVASPRAGRSPMTLDELKTQHPELCKELEDGGYARGKAEGKSECEQAVAEASRKAIESAKAESPATIAQLEALCKDAAVVLSMAKSGMTQTQAMAHVISVQNAQIADLQKGRPAPQSSGGVPPVTTGAPPTTETYQSAVLSRVHEKGEIKPIAMARVMAEKPELHKAWAASNSPAF